MQMAAAIDEEEPIGPRRVLDDERDSETVLQRKDRASGTTAPLVAASAPVAAPQPAPVAASVAPAAAPQTAPVAQPPVAAAPVAAPPVTVIDVNGGNSAGNAIMAQQTVQMQSIQATAQAQASVGLAQTNIDDEVVKEQLKKEEEHWVKAYWRPAMGWLYMLICLCDFILFPVVAMFLPVVYKGFGLQANYVAWQSLTLSNGGLIHLAFGAILGVSAWTRGQEKLAKMN
jgi:Holin of 3TMs, for gene-transfer release